MRFIYQNNKHICVLLLSFSLVCMNVISQGWTIWNCDTVPDDLDMFELKDDNPLGATDFSKVISDPDIPGNSLWQYDMYNGGEVESATTYRTGYGVTNTTNATIVARIKGIDGSLSDKVAEIDMRNISYGSKLQIYYDDSLMLADVEVGGETVAKYIADLTEWHLYRITMEGNMYRAYMDENTTPVLSGITTKERSDDWFKIGDGSGGTTISGIFDWMIWDGSGAYAPGEGFSIPAELSTDVYSSTGIVSARNKINDLKIYPVPANNYLYIEFPENSINSRLQIINMLGKTVYSTEVDKPKIKLNISGLSTGIYYVKMNCNNVAYIKQLIVN